MKYSSFSPERKREESKRKSVLKGTEVVSQWKFPKDSNQIIIVNIVDFYQKIITCII